MPRFFGKTKNIPSVAVDLINVEPFRFHVFFFPGGDFVSEETDREVTSKWFTLK